MEKLNQIKTNQSALDDDIIEMLAEAQESAPIPMELAARMRKNVLEKISQKPKPIQTSTHKTTPKATHLATLRAADGEWIEAMPGAQFRLLHDDGNGLDGLLSYLIKLEPGFEMKGHDHPFDEECLMLEGDLTLGDTTLNKGDFHFAVAGSTHGHVSSQKGCLAFIRGALPV